MANLVNTPQLAFPFNIVNGEAAVVEQDSGEDSYQNALIIMRYRVEQRTGLPEFGITDQSLREDGTDEAEIIGSITTWEPDIDIDMAKQIISDGIEQVEINIGAYDENPDLENSNG